MTAFPHETVQLWLPETLTASTVSFPLKWFPELAWPNICWVSALHAWRYLLIMATKHAHLKCYWRNDRSYNIHEVSVWVFFASGSYEHIWLDCETHPLEIQLVDDLFMNIHRFFCQVKNVVWTIKLQCCIMADWQQTDQLSVNTGCGVSFLGMLCIFMIGLSDGFGVFFE